MIHSSFSLFFSFFREESIKMKTFCVQEARDALPNTNAALCRVMGFALRCAPKPSKPSLKNEVEERFKRYRVEPRYLPFKEFNPVCSVYSPGIPESKRRGPGSRKNRPCGIFHVQKTFSFLLCRYLVTLGMDSISNLPKRNETGFSGSPWNAQLLALPNARLETRY